MGIDDVLYLKQHGRKESYLFLVDSSKRDRKVWRTPSEYEIKFESPFRNVYGIDVIDAFIPRTEYLVNEDNNTLIVICDGQTYTVRVDPGDYNISQLIAQFNKQMSDIPLNCEPYSKPVEINNKLRFFSKKPFQLEMSKSTIREVIGYAEPKYPNEDTTGLELFDSRISPENLLIQNTMYSPSPDPAQIQLITNARRVRQRFAAQTDGKIYNIAVVFANVGFVPAPDTVIQFVITDSDGVTYAEGDIDVTVNRFLQASGVNKNQTEDTVTAEKKSFIRQLRELRQTELTSETPNYYYITFYHANNTHPTNGYGIINNILSIDTPESQRELDIEVSTDSGATWAPIQQINNDLCVSIDLYSEANIIEPPGLFNLTGERFIQLRCKEIEQYLYGSRAYETFNVGLAKIQMGVFGYGQDRFDYSSIPPREFHPIGRLSSLTLRFEKMNGKLYDFKGVDHNLMLVIRYYTVKEEEFNQNILNPTYNPNLVSWLNVHADHNSESEEEY